MEDSLFESKWNPLRFGFDSIGLFFSSYAIKIALISIDSTPGAISIPQPPPTLYFQNPFSL